MKLENYFKNYLTIYLISGNSVVNEILFFLIACCFAAACEKKKTQTLMNMLNIVPQLKVLFLSGFGKLNVYFPLCFFCGGFRKIPHSERKKKI